MALFYRIEDADRIGIYRSFNNLRLKHRDEFYGERCPSPYDDDLLQKNVLKKMSNFYARDYIYGFKNIPQLKRWFSRAKWRHEMSTVGFKLNIYEVSDSRFFAGKSQCVIIRNSRRKLIDTMDLKDI